MTQIVATMAQMKELDRTAIEDHKIPSLELMERAARAVAGSVVRLVKTDLAKTDPAGRKPRAAVFCGPGNNGGDGIAVSRLLLEQGYEVQCFLIGKREKMTADARAMEERLIQAGGKLKVFDPEDTRTKAWLKDCDCMVDALFGVGLKRPVAGEFLTAVRRMNGRNCPLVSCDIPSGVDGDSGEILGEAVRADRTVTFTCGKYGLCQRPGRKLL